MLDSMLVMFSWINPYANLIYSLFWALGLSTLDAKFWWSHRDSQMKSWTVRFGCHTAYFTMIFWLCSQSLHCIRTIQQVSYWTHRWASSTEASNWYRMTVIRWTLQGLITNPKMLWRSTPARRPGKGFRIPGDKVVATPWFRYFNFGT